MIKFGNDIIKVNGDWLDYTEPPHVYQVILNQTSGGLISAQPMQGVNGTTVTLSNTPNSGCTFNGYNISGATLYDNNKFDINNSDVTCSASFINYNPLNLPPYTIRLRYTDGVIPSFSKGTGVQVSQSPNIWDLTYENSSWSNLLHNHFDLLEVLGANATNVTDMTAMFDTCKSLETVALFDTSNVTDMKSMFKSCNVIESIPLFNTSNVTNMSYMLYACYNLTTVPLFDTSNITNMNYMFKGCNNLTSIPLFDTSNVTNMVETFDGCILLEAVPLFNTSNVTTMSGLFRHCETLTTVPLFDTSNVTTMGNMFAMCYSLTSVPLFDTSNVTSMYYMFQSCVKLTYIPLFNTSKVTNMNHTFVNCNNVQTGALDLYRQASTQTSVPSQHQMAFNNCGNNTTTGAAELAQIPSDWK